MKNTIFRKEFNRYYTNKHREYSSIDEKLKENENRPRDYVKHPLFSIEKSFTDEKTFVENFANPLYTVHREYHTVVVETNGDKVSIKFFYGYKKRNAGQKWFKLVKNVDFLTVNIKTGDVYFGFLHNYQKKKKFTKSIRRNYFLTNPLSTITSKIKNSLSHLSKNSSQTVNEVVSIFMKNIPCPENALSPDVKLLRFYLDKKSYKYPNNFWLYSKFFISATFKKELKKNHKNIVQAFMNSFDLKGKKLRKFLHECTKLNIPTYLSARKLFGDDRLNQDGDFIKNILESSFTTNFSDDMSSLLSPSELSKVYQTYKNVILSKTIDAWTFYDHLSMYQKLKLYGETDLKWTTDGSDYKKFTDEHLDFTEKLEHYKKGTYTRKYPDYLVTEIEKEIDGYFPIILKTSKDYNEESMYQSNCVKGYIGRPGSLIISLRKGAIDSDERATLEYRVHFLKNSDTIYIDRVQSLGKFNQRLEDSWTDVLLKLDKIVVSSCSDKKLETVKINKLCSNGVFLESDSKFTDDGYLVWDTDNKLLLH